MNKEFGLSSQKKMEQNDQCSALSPKRKSRKTSNQKPKRQVAKLKFDNPAAYIFLVLLVVALFIFIPFAIVWALNALFPVLAIPYTFETWLATIVLSGVLKTTIVKK